MLLRCTAPSVRSAKTGSDCFYEVEGKVAAAENQRDGSHDQVAAVAEVDFVDDPDASAGHGDEYNYVD